MMIAETRTFQVGAFTVQQRPRFDNPAFGVYLVFRGGNLIGKSFSCPDLGCCEWLARNDAYAKDTRLTDISDGRPYKAARTPTGGLVCTAPPKRRGRKTNAERAARDAALLTEIPD